MTTIDALEREIERLSPPDLAKLRAWFMEYDAEAWDRQIETDALAGRLDALADAALADHLAGRSRPL
jgi:hypothetical protein